MAYDGLQNGNRVLNFSHSVVDSVVVDAILNTPTYWSRINGMGKKFDFPTKKFTLKVARTNQGQAVVGMEKLNSAASDTTIQLEFAHNAYTHPAVKPLLEMMAVEGAGQDIDLSQFVDSEAVAEINESLGSLIFGTGAGDSIIGLEKIVDDGTNSSTIGGQSRTTYSQLNATVTASGGTVSLSKMAKLFTDISSGDKKPTVGLTTKTVWNFLEELVHPMAREEYKVLPIRGKYAMRSDENIPGGAGFTSLVYKGMPIIFDEFATSGVLYFLNEDTIQWYGRTSVPKDFKGEISSISLGKTNTLDLNYKPSDFHGWFHVMDKMPVDQLGTVGRYLIVGQVCAKNPRRNGKLTGISGV